MRRSLVYLLTVALSLLSSALPAGAQGHSQEAAGKFRRAARAAIPGQYVVVFNDDTPGERVPALAARMAADHGGQLPLVVEEVRARRAPEHPPMTVERRRRLHEVGRLRGRACRVLLDAATVGQVDGDDLGGLRRREVVSLGLGRPVPRVEHDLPPLAPPPRRLAIAHYAQLTPITHRSGGFHDEYFDLLRYPSNGYIIHLRGRVSRGREP